MEYNIVHKEPTGRLLSTGKRKARPTIWQSLSCGWNM